MFAQKWLIVSLVRPLFLGSCVKTILFGSSGPLSIRCPLYWEKSFMLSSKIIISFQLMKENNIWDSKRVNKWIRYLEKKRPNTHQTNICCSKLCCTNTITHTEKKKCLKSPKLSKAAATFFLCLFFMEHFSLFIVTKTKIIRLFNIIL